MEQRKCFYADAATDGTPRLGGVIIQPPYHTRGVSSAESRYVGHIGSSPPWQEVPSACSVLDPRHHRSGATLQAHTKIATTDPFVLVSDANNGANGTVIRVVVPQEKRDVSVM